MIHGQTSADQLEPEEENERVPFLNIALTRKWLAKCLNTRALTIAIRVHLRKCVYH